MTSEMLITKIEDMCYQFFSLQRSAETEARMKCGQVFILGLFLLHSSLEVASAKGEGPTVGSVKKLFRNKKLDTELESIKSGTLRNQIALQLNELYKLSKTEKTTVLKNTLKVHRDVANDSNPTEKGTKELLESLRENVEAIKLNK